MFEGETSSSWPEQDESLPGSPSGRRRRAGKGPSRLVSVVLVVIGLALLSVGYYVGPAALAAYFQAYGPVATCFHVKHLITGDVSTLANAPIQDMGLYGYFDFRQMRIMHQVVLVLYNSTVDEHMQIMHAIHEANMRHDLNFIKHDCHKLRSACSSLGHGEIYLYEPALMFYHYGQWSESFHDEIQNGEKEFGTRVGDEHRWVVPRAQRVAHILKWASEAAERADHVIIKRENYFAELKAKTNHEHLMRQMAAAEEARKKEEAEGKKEL